MKIIRLSFAILSLACIAHGATNEAFEITSYFPDKGTVWIEYNGVRTNRPFSSFTAAEQQQITAWLADQEFEQSGLSVEIEENKASQAYFNERGSEKTRGITERIYYEVTVVNNTDVVLNNVQIECRTFFLQDITQSQRTNKAIQAKYGGDKCCKIEHFTLSIEPGETRKVIAAGITIRDLKTQPAFYSPVFTMSTIYTKDDLEGFSVSVSRKNRNGEVHSKTYEKGSPPNERDWVDYHEPGGLRSTQNDTRGLSEEDIARYTQQAEAGDYKSAFILYRQYWLQKDLEKMKYWADKTRELIAKLPTEDPMAAKILATLGRP